MSALPIPSGSQPSDPAVSIRRTPYTRFADSSLWSLQREYFERQGMGAWAKAPVPQYVTSSPSMAHAYVTLVLGFWRDLKRRGFSSEQPLYIIELGAGSGRFAYQFLVQFFAAFDLVRGPGDKVVYVMTDFAASNVKQWQQDVHAKLKPYTDQGCLDFSIFDAEADTSLHLQRQNIALVPGSLELPPVVIANYVFSALRQDLFFLDKDRIYEGWVALEDAPAGSSENTGPADDHPFASLRLTYQKHRVEKLAYADPAWCGLIEQYGHNSPPFALLFPGQALATLNQLRSLHGGSMMLLCADRGFHELRSSFDHQSPLVERHGSLSLPVNYHAMAALIRAQGGQCWPGPQDDKLAILASCWPDGKDASSEVIVPWPETALAAQQALQHYGPLDFYQVKSALESDAEYLSAADMLAYLRLSRWDVKVFYLFLPHLQGALGGLELTVQTAWLEALSQVWTFHLPIGEEDDLAFDLATLAAAMNRWRAAIKLFQQSLADAAQQLNSCGANFNLAIACWQIAAHDEAEQYMSAASALAPVDEFVPKAFGALDPNPHDGGKPDDDARQEDSPREPRISDELNRLKAWRRHCQQLLGGQSISLQHDSSEGAHVYATLLGVHHAHALYRLQRDPVLAEEAGVACLESIAHAQAWIAQGTGSGKPILAVLHPEFGLIGVAALAYADPALAMNGSQSARFYYWIGREFRHQGFGTEALMLLAEFAKRMGVRHLFSTVSKHNLVSQRTLSKLGGVCLPIDFEGGSPSHRFHHFGDSAGEIELHGRLRQLLAELNAPERLSPLNTDEPRVAMREG